jgi:2-iminobutanoate/2-iminopropanoate deaminase
MGVLRSEIVAHNFTNPVGVCTPAAAYSHSVEIPGGERTLYIAGQIGAATDGTVPNGITAQAEQVFQNMKTILAASGYSMADVVTMRVFLVNREDREGFSIVRSKHLGEHRPASTLVFVAGLALPSILVEVEVVAARA